MLADIGDSLLTALPEKGVRTLNNGLEPGT